MEFAVGERERRLSTPTPDYDDLDYRIPSSSSQSQLRWSVIGVQIIQIVSMCLLISETYHVPQSSRRDYKLIFMRLVVALFISLKVSSGVSLPHEVHSKYKTGHLVTALRYGVIFSILPGMMLIGLAIDFMLRWRINISLGDISHLNAFVLNHVSIVATILTTKQQHDIVSTVVNFAGLLIILELDDIAVKVTSMEVWSPRQNKLAGQANASKPFFIFNFSACLIFLLWDLR
jgi:membrane-associated HD superfamily phosphohydrolase